MSEADLTAYFSRIGPTLAILGAVHAFAASTVPGMIATIFARGT